MRLTSFSAAILLALLSAAYAQQSPAPTEPAAKGYTGAYGPAGPPTPYYNGPLPTSSSGSGLNVQGPDGSTITVKAVPCTVSSRETDGSTTCVGIPDRGRARRLR
jgi:hypothetical protein